MSGDERDPVVPQPEPHIDSPLQGIASWPPPAWATRTDVDGALVAHSRPIAEVRLLDRRANGAFMVDAVEVSQCDLVTTDDAGQVRVERDIVEVCVGGMRLSPSEARRMAAALVVAADIVDAGLVEQMPAAEREAGR